jgi:hypothetical protein
MSSVLFFAMVIAFVAGFACFGLSAALSLRDGRRRMVFFAGCLIGFWGACVGLMADEIADVFGTVQAGMQESVHYAFLEHWQRMGRAVSVGADESAALVSDHLCTAEELAGGSLPRCSLAVGVNSTAVCRRWVFYVPFLLRYVRPCPALRTTDEVLADAEARQALVDAINQPCDYLPNRADYASRQFRKALGCSEPAHGGGDGQVVLLVDQAGTTRTMVAHRGTFHFP